MQLLLSSHGITNPSISEALVGLLGKPIEESSNLDFVPADTEMAVSADRALGLVDFTLYPHLDRADMPDTSRANIATWAAGIPVPTYAIDEDTANRVVDGTVDVVSEGEWELFNP